MATYGYWVEVVLWDVLTGKHRRTFHAVNNCMAKPVFSPNGYRIAYAYSATAILAWDIDTGACMLTLDHEDVVGELLYSPKGDLIASGTRGNTVHLQDAETGVCLHTLYGHSYGVRRLAFSTGDRIISGDEANTKSACGTSHLERWVGGHTDEVNCVAFSPGNKDNTIRLWRLDAASAWRMLVGYTGSVICVTFSPTGNHIASVSADESIRLWDINTGTYLN